MGLSDIQSNYILKLQVRSEGAKKEIRDTLNEADNGAKKASGSVDNLGNTILKSGTAANFLGGVALKVFDTIVQGAIKAASAIVKIGANFVAQGVAINAEIETLKIAFINIVGNEKDALALMDSLRQRANLLGQDVQQVTKLGRGLLPFAENIEQFDQLLTISQQLAVLDPIAGLRGAGRALKEALSGNTRTLEALFELPRERLNALKAEFRDTQDMDVFLQSISGLVAEFGASATDLDAILETSRGKVAILGASMQEFQKIMGAPILQEFSKALSVMGETIDENSDGLKKASLEIGILLAALLKGAVKTFKKIVKGFSNIKEFGIAAIRGIATVLDTVLSPAFFAITTLIKGLNIALKALGAKTIDFEIPSLTESIDSALGGETTDLFQDLFPDFEENREELRDQFSGLLDEAEEFKADIGSSNEEFQEEDTEQWLQYLRQIRDIFERNQDQITQQEERHLEKLARIDKKANDKRASLFQRFAEKREDIEKDFNKDSRDINESFADEIEDIERDIQKRRQEIEKDSVKNIETIERNHTKTLENLRARQKRQLFDAVNARDARRVFEIMQESMTGAREATQERNENINEVKRERAERLQELKQGAIERRALAEQERQKDLADLRRSLQEKLAENEVWLNKELEQTRVNRANAIAEEEAANAKKLEQLQASLDKRLQLLARKWAEEGKLNQEMLGQLIQQAEGVFGPSGAYMSLMDGFLSGLNQRASVARDIISSVGGAAQAIPRSSSGGDMGLARFADNSSRPREQARGVSTQQGVAAARARRGPQGQTPRPGESADLFAARIAFDQSTIRAQHGFEGVVREPTMFMAGEPRGNPERVSIQPLHKSGVSGSDSMDVNLNISSDGSVTSRLEEMVSSKIAQVVGGAVRGKRRTRRG